MLPDMKAESVTNPYIIIVTKKWANDKTALLDSFNQGLLEMT